VNKQLDQIAEHFRDARRIVALTGAGASAESGIPTFRDALTGLWARFRPEELATPEAFATHPDRVTQWYESRRQGVLACQPNQGHSVLAAMEEWAESSGRHFSMVTQNVDGLHQRAGSRNVLELHGSLLRWRGCESGNTVQLPKKAQTEFPIRSVSGEMLRPDVVWFGEALPETVFSAALQATAQADVFLTIGTSSVVYPAAGLIDIALEAGAVTIEINPEETPFSGRVDHALALSSGRCLQGIFDRL
jgi:NAD-dependent deacetylase